MLSELYGRDELPYRSYTMFLTTSFRTRPCAYQRLALQSIASSRGTESSASIIDGSLRRRNSVRSSTGFQ